MNAGEKKIRLRTLQEDIEYIESKIAAIQLNRPTSGADAYRLERASWHLQEAIAQLRGCSFMSNAEDTAKILEVSIGSVRARRRCEVVGAETATPVNQP